MSGYVLTPLAKADILDIWAYIADHNQEGSDRVGRAIFDACAFLAEAPMWHIPALTLRPVRSCFWTLSRYTSYVVVYRLEKSPLQVLAVMHGKRNFKRILKQRP